MHVLFLLSITTKVLYLISNPINILIFFILRIRHIPIILTIINCVARLSGLSTTAYVLFCNLKEIRQHINDSLLTRCCPYAAVSLSNKRGLFFVYMGRRWLGRSFCSEDRPSRCSYMIIGSQPHCGFFYCNRFIGWLSHSTYFLGPYLIYPLQRTLDHSILLTHSSR